ncbi:MAG: DUF4433 domain-containing protein [Deltaproteobacteria bacterium]|nr:DUF4433 domain-containing protein [Deltaproteobacteria bacterium]
MPVPPHPGTSVGAYVPFYVCPRSVMLSLISRANHPKIAYRGGQNPILRRPPSSPSTCASLRPHRRAPQPIARDHLRQPRAPGRVLRQPPGQQPGGARPLGAVVPFDRGVTGLAEGAERRLWRARQGLAEGHPQGGVDPVVLGWDQQR